MDPHKPFTVPVAPGAVEPSGGIASAMPAPMKPRRRWLWPVILVALFVIGGGAAAYLLQPRTVTISGTVTLLGDGINDFGPSCVGTKGYDDLRGGAQVVVSDAAGVSLAVTQLSSGESTAPTNCVFGFSISVPSGKGVYGIQIGHRDKVQYNEADLKKPLALSIGEPI